MATIKPVIITNDQYKTRAGLYNLKIRVCHNRKVAHISTSHYIKPNQITPGGDIIRHPNAMIITASIRGDISRFERVILSMDKRVIDGMDISEIMQLLELKGSGLELTSLIDRKIEKLEESGSKGYAITMQGTKNTLERFMKTRQGPPVILAQSVDYKLLTSLERFLVSGGCTRPSAISVHMRNIRTVLNEAIKEKLLSIEDYPFRDYKIPTGKTAKRNLDANFISELYKTELESKSDRRARDLFMLSFLLIGMNFKDMLLCPGSSLGKNGRITYYREKTGAPVSVKVEPEAREIIERYKGETLLLNIMELKIVKKENRSTLPYKDIISQVNKRLKKIATRVGRDKGISTYYARHTWATVARSLGVSRDDISISLGHSDVKVRDVYIEESTDVVDRANKMVIDAICRVPG